MITSHLGNDDERTPEEELADSYDRIKQNVQSQILTTIISVPLKWDELNN